MSESEDDASPGAEITFDPEQDHEAKRALRQNYRSLMRKLEENQGNINEFTTDQLLHQVQQADKLFDKVKVPQEATLDSHLLLMASNVGAQKARAMKSNSGAFDVDDFVLKLLTFIGGMSHADDEDHDESVLGDDDQPLDWDRIGRQVMAKSRRVPTIGFMLGPLSIEQKTRGPSKRSKLEKNKDEERKPQELKEEDISRSKNETTSNVKQIAELLEEQNQFNLFKFVINPNDFAQSVENIFYLSFLIRDGKVALEFKDDEPIIFACQAPTDENYQDGLRKQQLVLEFDMAVWKRAIEVFNITESIIPQRSPEETRIGGKWYG